MKSPNMTIQMKATERYFPVVLFYKVVLAKDLGVYLGGNDCDKLNANETIQMKSVK